MVIRPMIVMAFASGAAAGAIAAALGGLIGRWGQVTLAVSAATLWAMYGWDHPDV
jgi:hypothetical protein